MAVPYGGIAEQRWGRELVRCGAELVGLSERLYGMVFVGAITFVGAASLAALVLLPVREASLPGGPTLAVFATCLLLVGAPAAVWRARALYRLLRRRRAAELAAVLVSALLVMHPMHTQLWWPSCALLMLLAVVVPLRRVLAYCLMVLAAHLASHLLAGEIDGLSVPGVAGLVIGYPMWSAAVAVTTDRLAAHVLRQNAARRRRPPPPRRVTVLAAPAAAREGAGQDAAGINAAVVVAASASEDRSPGTQDGEQVAASAPPAVSAGGIDRLTARQLQVVALLADGLRYREIAACLSISVRQVQRHVAHAVARLGVRSAYELTSVAVAQGLVPGSRGRTGPTGPSSNGDEAPPPPT